MEENKCPNCGAPIDVDFSSVTTKCSYCNSTFINDERKFKANKVEEKSEETKPIIDGKIFENSSSKDTKTKQQPKMKFHFLVFLILLFIFWPLGVIYAILCGSSNNNK